MEPVGSFIDRWRRKVNIRKTDEFCGAWMIGSFSGGYFGEWGNGVVCRCGM